MSGNSKGRVEVGAGRSVAPRRCSSRGRGPRFAVRRSALGRCAPRWATSPRTCCCTVLGGEQRSHRVGVATLIPSWIAGVGAGGGSAAVACGQGERRGVLLPAGSQAPCYVWCWAPVGLACKRRKSLRAAFEVEDGGGGGGPGRPLFGGSWRADLRTRAPSGHWGARAGRGGAWRAQLPLHFTCVLSGRSCELSRIT